MTSPPPLFAADLTCVQEGKPCMEKDVNATEEARTAPSANTVPSAETTESAACADKECNSTRVSDVGLASSSTDCSDSCVNPNSLPSEEAPFAQSSDPKSAQAVNEGEDFGEASVEQTGEDFGEASAEQTGEDFREESVEQTGEEYEQRAEEDMRTLCALFPALAPDGQILKIGELANPTRFAELREAGLSVEEAFLASNYRMLSSRPIELEVRREMKAHLRPTLPRSSGRAAAMPTSLLLRTRSLFEGLTDRELASLYRRVTD